MLRAFAGRPRRGERATSPFVATFFNLRGGGCFAQDLHDTCYMTCGVSKAKCEKAFDKCLKTHCKSAYAGDSECVSTADTFVMGVNMFGCNGYLGSQDEGCECVADGAATSRFAAYVDDFYRTCVRRAHARARAPQRAPRPLAPRVWATCARSRDEEPRPAPGPFGWRSPTAIVTAVAFAGLNGAMDPPPPLCVLSRARARSFSLLRACSLFVFFSVSLSRARSLSLRLPRYNATKIEHEEGRAEVHAV